MTPDGLPRQAWTAYPFPELPAHERGNVVEVTVLSYDGDKYALVHLPNGQRAEVKSGYLHDTIEACFDAEFGG